VGAWGAALALTLALFLASLLSRSSVGRWQAYIHRSGTFQVLRPPRSVKFPPSPASPDCPAPRPADWYVAATDVADVTGDGSAECVLLVWRPWRDWPIQRWVPTDSPLTGFHDARGESCHLILLDPLTGREVWAGSALPAPLLALAVGDVDADGRNEVVTLEGSYVDGRAGPASRVDVWRWNGFGFTLIWRSPPGVFSQLRVTDVDGDAVVDIAVR
jgi:hypothetical protein